MARQRILAVELASATCVTRSTTSLAATRLQQETSSKQQRRKDKGVTIKGKKEAFYWLMV